MCLQYTPMYTCIHVHTNIHIHISTYFYIYIYIYTYIYKCMYIYISIYIYIHIHIYTRTYIYKSLYIHTCTYPGPAMLRIIEALHECGHVPVVDSYLFIFLKFIQSVIPTIEYDYTMDVRVRGGEGTVR
jgi:hypothetical protein